MTDRKRPPPWFRCFASDDLASSSYFGLSVAERGLLDSMARAYWCEGPLPATPRLLAALVRLSESEVTASLTPGVLTHFERQRGVLVHRELARQRSQSDAARARMAEGGRKGGLTTMAARRETTDTVDDDDFEGGQSLKPTLEGALKPPDMKCNEVQ